MIDGMLSGLGNHHFHNTAAGLKQGGAPAFGRGLSSLHSGVAEPSTEELRMMKRRQYRLELERQVEEKKRRDALMANPTMTPSLSRTTLSSQPVMPQQKGVSGFAGFAGMGNHSGRDRNVRLGARRHIENETPEMLQERLQRRLVEVERKEIYANELRAQMAEREARRKAEKERIAREDERLTRKVQRDIVEEKTGARGDRTAEKPMTQADHGSGLNEPLSHAFTEGGQEFRQNFPDEKSFNDFSSGSTQAYRPEHSQHVPSAHVQNAPPSRVGDMATGSVGARGAQWKGFTRFKATSLDPEEHDAMLRKQRQQNETANVLRGQIEERRRRKEEAAKLREEEERREEERIERERQELEQRYAKQSYAEQMKRDAKSQPVSPKAPTAPRIERSVSAPAAQPTVENITALTASGSAGENRHLPPSPVTMTEEEEKFRQEMMMKQKELEAQLKFQKNLSPRCRPRWLKQLRLSDQVKHQIHRRPLNY